MFELMQSVLLIFIEIMCCKIFYETFGEIRYKGWINIIQFVLLKETELENIMYRFINGEIDVLVSTTIIETGLDISNVNTMIIHDADNMGLSQLYQLRGRVGNFRKNGCLFT